MPGRQILIADPDPETAQLLAPPLRERGHSVVMVKNGSRALELCVLRVPDLVLFDLGCGILDWQTFRQILRANPRTEHVPVLFTGSALDQAPVSLRDGFLVKPFNADEVLARIDQLFRRSDVAQRARRSDQGMEGAIGQLSLVDLLQVLGQSRKSGELKVQGPRGSALIRLRGGEVTSAQAENTRGLKAFFRLLSWRDGTFSFVPGPPEATEPGDIEKPVEELLLEGLRQSDELASIRDQLPDPNARLALQEPVAELLADQPPIAVELAELARAGSTVAEVLERARATDFVAAHTLLGLLQRGVLTPAPGDLSAREPARPLLARGAAHALRISLLHGRPDATRARGKLLLGGVGTGALAGFLEQLALVPGCSIALEEFRAVGSPFGSPFGSIGRLDVTDDLAFDLLQMPADEPSRPLWHPFSARTIGALAIAPDPSIGLPRALLTFLARDLAVPVVLVGPPAVPAELAHLAPELSATSEGPVEALRTLLARASERANSQFVQGSRLHASTLPT